MASKKFWAREVKGEKAMKHIIDNKNFSNRNRKKQTLSRRHTDCRSRVFDDS